jgi:hypothetical protein
VHVVAPPVIHAAHHNGSAAGADAVIRFVLPIGLFAIGSSFQSDPPKVVGFATGIAGAMAFDAAVLAYEPGREEAAMLPRLDGRGRVALSVASAF